MRSARFLRRLGWCTALWSAATAAGWIDSWHVSLLLGLFLLGLGVGLGPDGPDGPERGSLL